MNTLLWTPPNVSFWPNHDSQPVSCGLESVVNSLMLCSKVSDTSSTKKVLAYMNKHLGNPKFVRRAVKTQQWQDEKKNIYLRVMPYSSMSKSGYGSTMQDAVDQAWLALNQELTKHASVTQDIMTSLSMPANQIMRG